MKTLKFALIGCGRIAVRHSDLLGQKKIKGASLVAVSDLNIDKAKKIAHKFNIPFFSTNDEMIDKIDPDVLVILTESGFHAQHVCDLAKYGKPIIVEKPMEQNYEIKSKNREINSKLMERSMIQNKKTIDHQGQFLERPINSNLTMSNPKPNFDNIQFNPDNFQDQVKNYRNNMDDEKYQFEENLKNEKDIFYKKQREKEEKLNKSIKEFEDNYDPWNILGIEHGLMDISLIKKAYRKKALQYHPDKAGPKYEHIFNIVNQSYIYLLHKAEEEEEIEIKTTKEVTKQDYESFQDGMVNMHLDKDNFNINKFNEIFDKFRVGDENDDGYNDLLKDETNEQPLFNSKVSNEIFNAHFKKLKEKQSTALVAFDEPDSVNAVGSLQAGSLGASYQDGFGSSQSSNLGFTDIKQAYFDDSAVDKTILRTEMKLSLS